MIGVKELPQTATAMGEMDSNWCHATSPKAFIVIDDKGGEEHGLKLQLGKGEKKEKFEKKSSSECVCLSQTGLTGLRDWSDRSPFLYSETVIIRTLFSLVDLKTCNVCYSVF